MIVIAHRGASQEFFENSWPAFERAVELGCERIEMDLHLSKDQEVFIIHDNDLSRLLGLNLKIDQLSASEIKKLRLINDTAIPTLAEVLTRFGPKIELNLELKGTDLNLTKIASEQVK